MPEISEPLVGIRPSEYFKKELLAFEKIKDDELNVKILNILDKNDGLISFKIVRELYNKRNDGENQKLYLHEMLRGCEIDFWKPPKPKRNPELEARIQKLKAQQEEREYHEMTKNISRSPFNNSSSFQSEIRNIRSQMTAVINGLITIVGSFVFGYKAAEYLFSVSDILVKFTVGFSLALLVAVAELYFLIPAL